MNAAPAPTPTPSDRSFSPRLLAASVLIAAVAAFGAYFGMHALVAGGSSASTSATAVGPTPTSPAIEAKYGVRVVRISPTADTGLIEVLLQVLDINKASNMLGHNHNAAQPLTMVDADTGQKLLARTIATGDQGIVNGQTAYILFGNPKGTVHHGTLIDVHVGNLVLAKVPVQ